MNYSPRSINIGMVFGSTIGGLISAPLFFFWLKRNHEALFELLQQSHMAGYPDSPVGLIILCSVPGVVVGYFLGAYFGSKMKARD